MLNASNLAKAFLNEIEITGPQRKKIKHAQKIIRDRLRKEFRSAGRAISDQTGRAAIITPRFRIQGSMAYGTINQPIEPPKQQLDLDDGVYLPMSFMEETEPQVASDVFFSFVDGVLKQLATEMGWVFVGSKDTCSRLILNDESHIDLPLYAIPDTEFHLLEARMKAKGMRDMVAFAAADDLYVDPSQVQLAHRKKGWTPSDPRELHTWFLTAVEEYGEQFRRMCRLMKAWRDYHMDLDGLTSIAIMVAVFKVYEEFGKLSPRDDLALQTVTEHLPDIFKSPIVNPRNPKENLSARVPQIVMASAIEKVWDFHKGLYSVLHQNHIPENVVKRFREHLGDRVPYRPDFIKSEKARAEVARHPASTVAVPAAAYLSSRSG